MSEQLRADRSILTARQFAKLVNSAGWFVEAGADSVTYDLRDARAKAKVGADDSIVLSIKKKSGGELTMRIERSDALVAWSPSLLHVYRVRGRDFMLPKGAGTRKRAADTLILSFRNSALKQKVRERRRRLARESLTVNKEIALAKKFEQLQGLTIVKGSSQEDVTEALSELLVTLVYTVPPPELTKLWFEMADGTRYDGKLVNVDPELSHPPELEIKIDTMPEWISYDPISGTGHMWEEP